MTGLRYRLVVADVDGTLVEKGGDVPGAVRDAVREYRRRGGRFTLATGRPTPGVRHYAESLGLDTPAIVFNGAQVYDFAAARVLFAEALPLGLARRALELARRYPVDPFFYDGEEVIVGDVTARVEAYMRKDRLVCRPVGDLVAYLDRIGLRPPKLLFYGNVGASVRLMENLLAEGHRDLNYVQSDADFIELLPAGVSKGRALAWLADRLDVPLRDVMTIGDHHNDLELLRRAGLGVAVANAEEAVKREAGRVTRFPYGEGVVEALAWASGLSGEEDGAATTRGARA